MAVCSPIVINDHKYDCAPAVGTGGDALLVSSATLLNRPRDRMNTHTCSTVFCHWYRPRPTQIANTEHKTPTTGRTEFDAITGVRDRCVVCRVSVWNSETDC